MNCPGRISYQSFGPVLQSGVRLLLVQAVELFLAEKIGYLEVMKMVEETCTEHQNELVQAPSLEEIVHYDNWAREFVESKSAVAV